MKKLILLIMLIAAFTAIFAGCARDDNNDLDPDLTVPTVSVLPSFSASPSVTKAPTANVSPSMTGGVSPGTTGGTNTTGSPTASK